MKNERILNIVLGVVIAILLLTQCDVSSLPGGSSLQSAICRDPTPPDTYDRDDYERDNCRSVPRVTEEDCRLGDRYDTTARWEWVSFDGDSFCCDRIDRSDRS